MGFPKKIEELRRPVDVESIDFRIQSVSNSGWAVILAYKDARYDMNTLDDVVGPENWARDHRIIDGNLYCGIGIRFERGDGEKADWVWKWDVGTESKTEAEKGQASDSFKRAGFNWGIGRDLYDFPMIMIKLQGDELRDAGGGKKKAGKFYPKNIVWTLERNSDGVITKLIGKYDDKERFTYSLKPVKSTTKNAAAKPAPKKEKPAPKKEVAETQENILDATEDQACLLAKACTSRPELNKLWGTFPKFQTKGSKFYKEVQLRTAELLE